VSLVYEIERELYGGRKYRTWKCSANLRGAKLEHRTIWCLTAIVHRSTTNPAKWRVTYFDRGVPTGHVIEDTCDEAMAQLPPGHWRLIKAR